MISKFSINRPIVAMVIAILTVVPGLIAMQGLPLAQLPEIVPPQVIVSTNYTGADDVTNEQSVATPLEQQMNGVDNISLYDVRSFLSGRFVTRILSTRRIADCKGWDGM